MVNLMDKLTNKGEMSDIISVVSDIRELGRNFILTELLKNGVNDLDVSHGHILTLLYYNEKLQMKELSQKIKRGKSTVTVLISKLLKNGYIKKEQSSIDKRIFYISLTEKSKKLRPIFFKISRELNLKFSTILTDEESQIFLDISRKVINSWNI